MWSSKIPSTFLIKHLAENKWFQNMVNIWERWQHGSRMAFYGNPSEAGLEHFNRLPLSKEWYSLGCSHFFPQELSTVSHIIGSKKPWPLLIFLHTSRERKITELYGFHMFGKVQNFNTQHQSSISLSLSLSLPLSVLFLVEERTAQL